MDLQLDTRWHSLRTSKTDLTWLVLLMLDCSAYALPRKRQTWVSFNTVVPQKKWCPWNICYTNWPNSRWVEDENTEGLWPYRKITLNKTKKTKQSTYTFHSLLLGRNDMFKSSGVSVVRSTSGYRSGAVTHTWSAGVGQTTGAKAQSKITEPLHTSPAVP